MLAALATLAGVVGLIGFENLDAASAFAKGALANIDWTRLAARINTQNVIAVISFVLGASYSVNSVLSRRTPLKILKTSIEILVDQGDRSGYSVVRKQLLRAASEDVTAYHITTRPVLGGTIPEDGISGTAFNPNPTFTYKLHKRGSETKGWDLTHQFIPKMPFNPFSIFIPDWAILAADKLSIQLFNGLIVRRELTVLHKDGTLSSPYYSIEADKYVHRNLSITVKFADSMQNFDSDVRVVNIRSNAYIELKKDWSDGFKTLTISARSLRSEKIRVDWPK